jgi:RNA polymerase sigma factor (sigma-70 family)
MERTDGELLIRFAADADPAAFEEVVRRHSRLVLGVCRSYLGQHQDAEDAAQAVFLVLSRKAGSLAGREHIGGWLQRTAVNVCRHARRAREIRRTYEEEAAVMNETRASGRQDSERIAEWMHEALADVPERYRTPIVLCDLQGYSLDDAGRKLGTTGGTVGSWLSRGRAHLRRALLRHGAEVPIAALIPGVSETLKAVCVREEFVTTATKTGVLFASGNAVGGVSGGAVTALAKGTMKMMIWEQVKVGATVAAGIVLAGTAVTVAALQKSGSPPDRPAVSVARTNALAHAVGDQREIVKDLSGADSARAPTVPVNPGVLSQGRHGAFSKKAAEGTHLQVMAATYFGGGGAEEFVGAAEAADGSLIVLGNSTGNLPAGRPHATVLGGEDAGAGGLDKTGILVRYDSAMTQIVAIARFGWGAADITCVCAATNRQQVYFAGRATPAWVSRGTQTFGLTGSAKVGGGTVGAYVIEMGTASTQVTRFWTIEGASQVPRAIFTDAGSNVYVDVGAPIRIGADGRDMRAIASRTSSGKWPGKWLAVNPKDGNLYWGGSRNTSTGREPYRQPFLYCFDGDGNKLSTLWEPAPQEIGSGPGGGHLESDSSIQAVAWDRDGRKMIVAGWSDGGNTVFGRQATNWHVSAGSRIGMGMDFSGMKGVNSLASLMVLDVASRSTEGVLSWAAYVPSWFQDAKFRGAPNAATIERLVVLANCSVAVSGKAATGLIQPIESSSAAARPNCSC